MLNFLVKNRNYLALFFTLAYTVAFSINALSSVNYEFLYYTFLILILIVIIIIINKRLDLDFFILFNLSLLGFFHLLGGNLRVNDHRLYDFALISGLPWHYDNFIHTYGSFIATLALYSLLSNYIDDRVKKKYFIFAFVLVLMAMGLGTIIELCELFAALYLNAAQQVGDYYNNAFDLFYNTIGAILATVVIYLYRQRPKFIQKINDQNRKIN
ncbi:MAG: hypothetical protein WCX08_01650 [Candidatus Buchananbacteria bacterium]